MQASPFFCHSVAPAAVPTIASCSAKLFLTAKTKLTALLLLSVLCAADGFGQVFSFTGTVQTYTVTEDGCIMVKGWGAGGGGGGTDSGFAGGSGGGGAYSEKLIAVNTGDVLEVYVGGGGGGGTGCVNSAGGGIAGFGFGSGGAGGNSGNIGCSGGGGAGGGASTVLLNGTVVWVAAGGGGGGGAGCSNVGGHAGGGGQIGSGSNPPGAGGNIGVSATFNGENGINRGNGDGAGGGGGGGGANGGGGGGVTSQPGTDCGFGGGAGGGAGGASIGTTVIPAVGVNPGNFGNNLLCSNCAKGGVSPAAGTAGIVHLEFMPGGITVSPDMLFCAGQSTELLAEGGQSYIWSPAESLSDPTVANPTASPVTTTTYTVLAIDSNGCSAQGEVTLFVDALPDGAVSSNESICQGESVLLNANGGEQYQWSPATGLSCADCPSPMANPDTTTDYTVIITASAGCEFEGQVTVAVTPLPVANAGPDVPLCIGQSVQLNATGGESFVWSPSSDLSNANDADPLATPDESITYTVTVTTNGCTTTDQVNVSVFPVFNQTFSASSCQNVPYIMPNGQPASGSGIFDFNLFTAQGCDSLVTVDFTQLPAYDLSFNRDICQGQSFILPNGQSVNSTGTYLSSLTAAAGCDSLITIFLTVHPLPQPDFTWVPEKPYLTDLSVQFTNMTINGNSYLWEFGDVGTSVAENPTFLLPENEPGYYTVCLIATSNQGCVAESCGELQVLTELNFWVPNAFSPNNDMTNEVFKPILNGHDPDEYLFQIFDRWGNKIFETANPDEGWMGNHREGAHYIQNEVYLWMVELKQLVSSNRQKFRGHVTLIR